MVEDEHSSKGKIALVTGGDRGIGKAIVKVFAHHGARFAFTYCERERARPVPLKDSLSKMAERYCRSNSTFQAVKTSKVSLLQFKSNGATLQYLSITQRLRKRKH